MPREQFLYNGTQQLCDLLDEAGRRAGVSRGQAFEDFLACTVSALSNRQMEDEYLAVVRKGYADGEKGRRGVDSLTQAFGTLIDLMERTRKDILGDLFQGGITYGEAGQFLTPRKVDGFDVLVRHHYEYYKFHGNMLIAVLFWSLLRHAPRGSISWSLSAVDLLAVVLMVVLFLGSRDNLRNYYRRTQMLLGPVREQPRSPPPANASNLPSLPPFRDPPFQFGHKRGQVGAKGGTDCPQLDNV